MQAKVVPKVDEKPETHVLIIDDQVEVRRVFATVLSRLGGYVVTEAGDARSAIELVKQGQFDLVLSDVHMPDMNGLGLLRALHEHDPDLPVLLISGKPDLTTAVKAVEYRAFEYLMKPIPNDKLLDSVARAATARRERLAAKIELERYRSGERMRLGRDDPSDRNWTGELLGGRYLLGRFLGQGGMGSVYQATDQQVGQVVAVKVLHRELSGRPDLITRFRREAEMVTAVDHPNIVRMLDFNESEQGPVFLVMEYLDGKTLSDALCEGTMTPDRAISIAAQILTALAAAHQMGIIHRDLKPDNIFLTPMSDGSDQAKLLDFGIAKLLPREGQENLTHTGMIVGTPPYMAPEHARGVAVDARADVYAVGCILYEALCGEPPFQADNYNALILRIVATDPTPLAERRADLDPELLAIVAKAMARDPAERYQTANEMATATSRWVAAAPTPSQRPTPNSSRAAFAPTLVREPSSSR
ncbi:MAG TPA: protein kinase [Polyangiaceae bacterium]|nr:protein kinase [Polyangiaceae bacterium]